MPQPAGLSPSGLSIAEGLVAPEALPLVPNPGEAEAAYPWELPERVSEVQEKLARVRQWLEQRAWSGVYLQHPRHFGWLTAGGDNRLLESSEQGFGGILITASKWYLIAPQTEMPRLLEEDLAGLGVVPKPYVGYRDRTGATPNRNWYLDQLVGLRSLAADTDVPGAAAQIRPGDLDHLQSPLTASEIERYRWLGARVGSLVSQVCAQLQPGVTEEEMAARLTGGLRQMGIRSIMVLVAGDQRAAAYPHALPTSQPIRRCGWIKLAAERGGVAVQVARTFCFGPPAPDWLELYRNALLVQADLLAHTRPGVSANALAQVATDRYRAIGVPAKSSAKDPGKLAGSLSELLLPLPSLPPSLPAYQAIAWDASIQTGVVQDTILLWPDRVELLTVCPDWPTVSLRVGEHNYALPDVAVLPLTPQ